MCGLAGSLVFDGAFRITEPYLMRMRDTMTHRGPDGSGLWIADDGRVGLGHRRLSILDLSQAASQPMCNEDGTLWVVFNGEIYNCQDIRQELVATGQHRWKTDHSDTEVILHAFEEWGIDCLARFRGMFSIALWDCGRRELWLVRDRLGIKPLYYSIHHGRLTFASEIKALLIDPDQAREIDEEAFFHYLSFLATPAPQTLFSGIKKLPAGTWLRITADGHLQPRRYWDLWENTGQLESGDDEYYTQQVLAELRTAVRLHKISDVPVGVFLSGGIDSSTNTALFSEGETRPVKTFSIGYDADYGSYPSELPYARQMAAVVGADHHERILTRTDLLDILPTMAYHQDEPLADPVCVPVYYVSQLARANGVVVCQVGEGADEIFWGYSSWKRQHELQQLGNLFPFGFPKRLAVSLLKYNRKIRNTQELEWLRRNSLGQPIFWGGASCFSEIQKTEVLSAKARRRFVGYSSYEALRPLRQRFEERCWEPSEMNWMSYLDLNLRLPELLLMRVDKMSMALSLETRVPFLDHKLVEMVMSIPGSVKTRNGELKHLLKRAVRGIIPDTLIDRRKQGFGVPIFEWSADIWSAQAQGHLKTFCEQVDLLDKRAVARLSDQRSTNQAWCLMNLAMWWSQYLGR